jgi:hypothetical protein
MKNYIFLLSIIAVLILNSCEKNQQALDDQFSKKIENLHSDKIFQDFLIDEQQQVLKLTDINKLKNYISDNRLTDDEQINIHKLFGYSDYKVYWEERVAQNERVKYLFKKYDIKNANKDMLRNEITKAQALTNIWESSYYNVMSKTDLCEKIRINCLASVAAEATIMHLGCATLDITVVAGIICHSAATIYQITASNNCNLQAQQCRQQQILN